MARKIAKILLAAGLLGVMGWVAARQLKHKGMKRLRVGKEEVWVEVRDTDEGRQLGLSGREGLKENEGMLFVFEKTGRHSFWMKEMRFDLDLVFIKDNQVVELVKEVKAPRPDEVPRSIRPTQEAEMVLEVNSGWVDDNSIKLDDVVSLTK